MNLLRPNEVSEKLGISKGALQPYADAIPASLNLLGYPKKF